MDPPYPACKIAQIYSLETQSFAVLPPIQARCCANYGNDALVASMTTHVKAKRSSMNDL